MWRSSTLEALDRLSDLERVPDSLSKHVVHADEQRCRANAKTLSGLHLHDRTELLAGSRHRLVEDVDYQRSLPANSQRSLRVGSHLALKSAFKKSTILV